MMVLTPTRLANRRPQRPAAAAAGRRRREAAPSPREYFRPEGGHPETPGGQQHPGQAWWPTWGEEDLRLLPQVQCCPASPLP